MTLTVPMFYMLCGLSVLAVVQLIATIVLVRQRRGLDLARVDARLSHFAEALALLTDTTQSGFASVAAELERPSRRKAPASGRAATARRIVSAAQSGHSIQDIAAAEDVSESEIRLHLGLAEDLITSDRTSSALAHDRPRRRRRTSTPTSGEGA